MSKLRDGQTSASYGHRIAKLRTGEYRISWTTDRKYGRLRYPRVHERIADEKGARRFAKRWGIEWKFDEAAS